MRRKIAYCLVFLAIVAGMGYSAVSDLWSAHSPALGDVWRINPSGHLLTGANASYDIGTSTNYVRTLYCANFTATGTYSVDDLGATDDLTVGDDADISGALNVTETATVGNLVTGGVVNATGTITGGNIVTAGASNTTGTITGGNIVSTGANNLTSITATNTVTTSLAAGGGNQTGNVSLTNTSANFQGIDTTAGNLEITIPAAPAAGKYFVIADKGGSWSASSHCLVNVTGGGTIDGVNNITSTTANGTIRVMYDGDEWLSW